MLGFTSPPAGWLPCNGVAVDIATYQTLHNVIGNNYAAGKTVPAGKFYLPDFTDAFPMGMVPNQHGGANSRALLGETTSPVTRHTIGAQPLGLGRL